MPRSSSGVFTLAVAPFTPNTIIKSADVNLDLSDIATALTQSLATTGVSTMTGPIKAFAGSATNPGYAFASALHTGFYLSGANEVSWVANGVVGAVFYASTTVQFNGNVIYAGGISITGSVTVGSNVTVGGSLSVTGPANFASSVKMSGPLYVTASEQITGGLYVTGEIVASSSVKLAGPLYVTASESIGGGLYVSGGIIASSSVTLTGPVVVSTSETITGGLYVGGSLTVQGDISLNGATNNIGGANSITNINAGVLVVSSVSVRFAGYAVFDSQAADPTASVTNKVQIYVKADGFSSAGVPFARNNSVDGAFPLMFTGGQCQLTISGTSLLLSPFGGNRLTINGIPQIIPDVGVSLAASNTAATFVYIYAYMNSGTMTLEKSTTAPVIQAGTGVRQKTGDATRTLVGAAYTDAGGAWADTNGKLWVLSYFNRRRKSSITYLTVSNTTATAVYTEIDSTMRNNFISWSDEIVNANSNTWLVKAGAGGIQVNVRNEVDTTPSDSIAIPLLGAGLYTALNNYSVFKSLTEAATHYATTYAASASGGTWVASIATSNGEATHVYVDVNG